MNKVIIDNLKNIDTEEITVTKEESKLLDVKVIKIKIKKDTSLEIAFQKDVKADIYINIEKNVKANIYQLKENGTYKLQYKYYLEENSYLNTENIIDAKQIKEMTVINLNGQNAEINYNLKTISKEEEKYNFLVYHKAKNTISHIRNNGVNIKEGKLEFNVSSFVNNGIKGCNIAQDGRIINMTKNICTIKPNLFIDENDVIANHSALIGTFSFNEIFYIMSRGIEKKDAENLLTQGFLLKNITHYENKIKEIINKYWRWLKWIEKISKS